MLLPLFKKFLAINRPDITDTEMETIMDTIVDSLFCFFVTLGKSKFVVVVKAE